MHTQAPFLLLSFLLTSTHFPLIFKSVFNPKNVMSLHLPFVFTTCFRFFAFPHLIPFRGRRTANHTPISCKFQIILNAVFQNHLQRSMKRNFSWWSDNAEVNWKVFTRAGFKFAPSGCRCEFKSRSNQHFSVDFSSVRLWKISLTVAILCI